MIVKTSWRILGYNLKTQTKSPQMTLKLGVTLTIFQKIVSCASPIYVFILKMDFKRVIGYIFKTKPTPYEMFEQIQRIDKVTPKLPSSAGGLCLPLLVSLNFKKIGKAIWIMKVWFQKGQKTVKLVGYCHFFYCSDQHSAGYFFP